MYAQLTGIIAAKRRPQLATAALLVVSFVASRAIFRHLGIQFDSSSLEPFWQYLDVDVLRHNLLSGLFYMHSQPPGFNLFLGLVLKGFPHSSELCFHIIYMLLGFVLYCSLYLFLRLSAFSRTWAFVCSFLFIVSPNSILYENWLFYTYPIAVLLVVASIALHRYQERKSPFYAATFLFIITIVCLTRSMFHLVFLLACVAFVILPREGRNRKVVCCAVAAVCLVGSLYLKNLAVFGFFGPSSWVGMNLFKVAQHAVGTNAVNELVQRGSIPNIASQPPFAAIDEYATIRGPQRVLPDVAPLTAKTKTGGEANFNHADYLRIAQEYRVASLYIIRENPRLYLSAVFDAWCCYCKPSWDYGFLERNDEALAGWLSVLSLVRTQGWIDLGPLKRWAFGCEKEEKFYPLTSILFLPSIILLSCVGSVTRMSRFARRGDSSGLAFVFMTFTVVYVAVLGNALELGENNRFRTETDPLIFLLGIMMARDAYSYTMQRMIRRRGNKSMTACTSPGADAR